MAVREFNGSTDHIKLAPGGLSAATFGTYGAIYKADDTAAGRSLMIFLSSGNAFLWCPFLLAGDAAMVYNGTGDSTIATTPEAAWVTMIVRKATGTATPRFSYYNHTSTTWTHANGHTTTGNGTSPGASGFIDQTTDGTSTEAWDGRIAVLAGWSNAVHWSADSTGDSQIEAAGLEDSLQNWVDESPDMLCPFNQANVADDVVDIVGTSDQTAISGTSVVTTDDPPGFSFELGGGGGPELMPRAVIVAG